MFSPLKHLKDSRCGRHGTGHGPDWASSEGTAASCAQKDSSEQHYTKIPSGKHKKLLKMAIYSEFSH